MRRQLKWLLQSAGYTAGRYNPRTDSKVVRRNLFNTLGVDMALDVGANAGQFARQIRGEGFRGRIVSFEPLSSAYQALASAAKSDPLWETHRVALGSASGVAAINVAGNSWSSSLLPMLESHRSAAPHSAYVGVEQVRVRTLDEMYEEICPADSTPFMKVDTQGFTMHVLQGGSRSLEKLSSLQVELSLVPLYADEPLIAEVLAFLYARHFKLVYIEPEFTDHQGFQLQVNGLFARH